MSEQEKKHYHLIYGEVIYTNKDDPQKILAINLNAVLVTDKREVSSVSLAEAQQTLQQGLFMRADPETLDVKDALIKSLSYLGDMTVSEFAGSDVLAEAQKAVQSAAKGL